MDYEEGALVEGEVVALRPYGAFVQLPNGEIGMVHISEVAEEYVSDISHYLAVGDEVMVKVLGRNAEGKINLSLKQVTKEDLEAARFSQEVERVRQALEQQNGSLRARLARHRGRPAWLQREETLRNWIATARRELERIERRRFGRLSRQAQPGQQRGKEKEREREKEKKERR